MVVFPKVYNKMVYFGLKAIGPRLDLPTAKLGYTMGAQRPIDLEIIHWCLIYKLVLNPKSSVLTDPVFD